MATEASRLAGIREKVEAGVRLSFEEIGVKLGLGHRARQQLDLPFDAPGPVLRLGLRPAHGRGEAG